MKNWNHIEGNFAGELTSLYDKAVSLAKDGDIFVEIGVYKGKSTSYLIDKIKESGKKIFIDVIDTWSWNAEPNSPDSLAGLTTEQQFFNNIDNSYIRNVHRLHPIEASKFYQDEEVFFAFLSNHTYSYILDEIKHWFPKVNTILGGHNYTGECKISVNDFFRSVNTGSTPHTTIHNGQSYDWTYDSWHVFKKEARIKDLGSTDYVYELVNRSKDSTSKFRSFIQDVEIEPITIPQNENPQKKMCIAYMLWSHFSYLKMMYHSVLALKTYSNFDGDILIFAKEDIAKHAETIMEPLIGKNKVIPIREQFYRHNLIPHDRLKEYEVVLYCDGDGFPLTYEGSDMYDRIYNFAKEGSFVTLKVGTNSATSFEQIFSGWNNSAKKFNSTEEVMQFFSRFTGIQDYRNFLETRGYWIMGGFNAMRTDFYKEHEEEFLRWEQEVRQVGWPCDETFLMTWAETHNIPIVSHPNNNIATWDFSCSSEQYQEYYLQKKWFEDKTNHFFHPITGNREEFEKEIINFLGMIRRDAKEKFIHA